MYPDFKEFLSALNAHKVKYLVVGGYAVSEHAQPRATKDLDILIQRNAVLVPRAMGDFGAPIHELRPDELIEKGKFFSMGVPPVAVDILNEIDGMTFSQVWKNRESRIVDKDTSLTVHFISLKDLITAKLAAGRPRDLADVDELRKAASVKPKPKAASSPAGRRTGHKKPSRPC